jgi:hypothetical protein
MVLRGNHHVLHAGFFRDGDPFPGIEFCGIESGGKLLVIRAGNVGGVLNPLTVVRPTVPFSGRMREILS